MTAQNRSLISRRSLLVAGGIALLAAGAGGVTAMAQMPAATVTPPAQSGRGPGGGPGGRGERGMGPNHDALATWLGITADQLHTELHADGGKSLAQVAQAHGKSRDQLITFLTEQRKAQLAEAVAAGRLTQAQADAMLVTFQQNVGAMIDRVHSQPGPGGRGGGTNGPGGAGRGGMRGIGPNQAALATFLGITPEQLHTELHADGGKSLAQVAQAHGKTRDQLITFLIEQHKARLAEAVAAGRLTQAQADTMQQQFTQNVGQLVDRVHDQAGMPGGPGGRGGKRGPGGPNGSGNPAGPRGPRATATPSA